MPKAISPKPVTIPSGQSLTLEIDLGGMNLAAIGMPAAWTAANLTLQASDKSGGAYQDVYDDAGAEVVLNAAAAHVIVIGTATKNLKGLRFVKIRSGTGATPVPQTPDRVLTLFLAQDG